MQRVDDKILGALLDSYENSKLSRHENVKRINISYEFNRKNIPLYYDESSLAADEINEQMLQLQPQALLRIVWKNNRPGDIIDKVILCDSEVSDIYKRLRRIPRKDVEKAALELLHNLETEVDSEGVLRFIRYLTDKIEQGRSVKEFCDIADLESVKLLICGTAYVVQNKKESYVREFSMEHFHDSKTFEAMIPRICKSIRWINDEFADYENDEILEEFSIFKNPGYVYVKGTARLVKDNGGDIDISSFSDGIGFALESHQKDGINIVPDPATKEVYTIENLTSFYRFEKKDCLAVYLGGYHNGSRRQLLKSIYRQLPKARYYHFGDIDVGGFQIYYHLKAKTGIPFQTYHMDLDTIKQYENYAKELTDNDIKRLKKLMDSRMSGEERALAEYMLLKRIKLEQECIRDVPFVPKSVPCHAKG